MKENFEPTVNPEQERNLALERAEAVIKHDEILKVYNDMTEDDKEWNNDKQETNNPEAAKYQKEMAILGKNVYRIDEYRKLATPKETENNFNIDDISNLQKLEDEKQRIDKEIIKLNYNIKSLTVELSALRKELNLPQSDDIPSLVSDKIQLQKLMDIKNNLESQIAFEKKKIEFNQEESKELEKREKSNLEYALSQVSFDLKKLSDIFRDRQSRGYEPIFSDLDGFRNMASRLENFSDQEDLKSTINNFEILFEKASSHLVNDDPDSLFDVVSALRRLEGSLSELSSGIKSEEERKEFSRSINSALGSVNSAANLVNNKAHALQEYQSMRMR
jgi:hypothetical protein